MKSASVAAWIAWSCFAVGLAGSPPEHLRELYDRHQWFALRDEVANIDAPAFYRGAVACAFNDVRGAEKHLGGVIRSAPRSEQAGDARGLLTYVYQRAGRYGKALAQVEAMLQANRDAPGAENARALFGIMSRYPEQSIAARRPSNLRCLVREGNLFVPVSVNGRAGNYILDTGANFSTVSDSEARRLGLTVAEAGAKGTDSTGGEVGVRVTVADRLLIGETELRHVVFLVLRDDQQPFIDLPPGDRGVIGLPVLLALETIRWNPDGQLAVGFSPAHRRLDAANLCFEGAMPVTEAQVEGSWVSLVVDTGAAKTDLWPAFAAQFATLVERTGVKGSRKVTGVGRSVEIEERALPELTVHIGGFPTVLRPAHVLLEDVGERWHQGRVGLDVLRQARSVTLDFVAMKLTLE